MQELIEVENIKCGGCANSIQKKLLALDNVNEVNVNVEQGAVGIEGEDLVREQLVELLKKLGYPERDSVEGVASFKAKAKSFVSCAVGRMDKD